MGIRIAVALFMTKEEINPTQNADQPKAFGSL
jgi:hypothetical protein